jgi:hypothetical protein
MSNPTDTQAESTIVPDSERKGGCSAVAGSASHYPEITPLEIYELNGLEVVVHERRDGNVYGHQQNKGDTFAGWGQFRRWDESMFDAKIAEVGAVQTFPLNVADEATASKKP